MQLVMKCWIPSQSAIVLMICFYVLQFPDGHVQWNLKQRVIKDSGGREIKNNVVMVKSRYMVHREENCSPLLRSRRIMKQFVVEHFCMGEEMTLLYLRDHQSQL